MSNRSIECRRHVEVEATLRLAFKALDIVKIHYTQNRHVNEAITAIKETLMSLQDGAQPAVAEQHKQELCEYCKRGLKTMCLCGIDTKVIHQFRSPPCADWYDGVPDHHDGHGPYEVRTLYTTPPQRTAAEGEDTQRAWVGLTDDERLQIYLKSNGIEFYKNFAMNIEAKLKEKNNGS